MIKCISLGGMAQLVEHSLHMRGVTGSSPVVSTKGSLSRNSTKVFVCGTVTIGGRIAIGFIYGDIFKNQNNAQV